MDFKVDTENRMKNTIVNQQKKLAGQKVQEERNRKIQAAQGGNYEKVNNEEQMRLVREEEVMNMERLEMELIKKLQNTQAIQKDAYQELQRILNEPTVVMAPPHLLGFVPRAKNTKAQE